MEEKFQRVFIHELGHLVAKELTFRNFDIRKADRIEIIWVPMSEDYVGYIVPYIPPGADPNQPTVNYSEKLVDLEYGCFFQAIFLGSEFKSCFSSGGNGKDDLLAWEQQISETSASGMKLSNLQKKQFEELKGLELESDLKALDPQDFIAEVSGNLTKFNTAKILKEIEPLLAKIEPIFLNYLSEVRKVMGNNPIKA